MSNLKLIKATKADCKNIYDWANEEEVRKNSFNSDLIKYEDHVKWFESKLNDEDVYLFIVKDKGEEDKDISVGMLRLERQENNSLLINFSIDVNSRGKGYATKLLKFIKDKYRNELLVGKVKTTNIGSMKAFEKSEYWSEKEGNHMVYYSKEKKED